MLVPLSYSEASGSRETCEYSCRGMAGAYWNVTAGESRLCCMYIAREKEPDCALFTEPDEVYTKEILVKYQPKIAKHLEGKNSFVMVNGTLSVRRYKEWIE